MFSCFRPVAKHSFVISATVAWPSFSASMLICIGAVEYPFLWPFRIFALTSLYFMFWSDNVLNSLDLHCFKTPVELEIL